MEHNYYWVFLFLYRFVYNSNISLLYRCLLTRPVCEITSFNRLIPLKIDIKEFQGRSSIRRRCPVLLKKTSSFSFNLSSCSMISMVRRYISVFQGKKKTYDMIILKGWNLYLWIMLKTDDDMLTQLFHGTTWRCSGSSSPAITRTGPISLPKFSYKSQNVLVMDRFLHMQFTESATALIQSLFFKINSLFLRVPGW